MSRLRRLPRDYVVATILTLLGLVAAPGQDPTWAAVPLSLLMTVPLAWRRRNPLAVTTAVMTSVMTQSAAVEGSQPIVPLCVVIVAFTAGHELGGWRAWAALGLIVLPMWIGLALIGAGIGEVVATAVIFGAAWVFGQGLRHRGAEVSALAAHAEQLELEGQERAAAAAAAERERIARELHDIVAHSISVVAVQTQAVRRRLGPGTEREQDDLQAVEATAREAMVEMRRLLGVLRAPGGEASLSPQPGLAQLPRLLDGAGVEVEMHTEGEPRPLPPGVDLAAYRVIQEALTNVRKHAPASSARVALAYGHDALAIRIENDGAAAEVNGRSGFGLVGMRERIRLYGGRLEAGPRAGGGFAVFAQLPYAEARS